MPCEQAPSALPTKQQRGRGALSTVPTPDPCTLPTPARSYKEGSLSVGESSCVDRCAAKYWQVRRRGGRGACVLAGWRGARCKGESH